MKYFALLSTSLICLALAACGQSDSDQPTTSTGTQRANKTSSSADRTARPVQRRGRLAMTQAEIAKLPQYVIREPHGPPPRHLVIRNPRKGFGAKMKAGDTVLVDFAGVEWGYTIKTTPATRNAPSKFAFGEIVKAWKVGLPGMRVGGRRELIVPQPLSVAGSAMTYIVDLLAIYPPSR